MMTLVLLVVAVVLWALATAQVPVTVNLDAAAKACCAGAALAYLTL
jgi:hypothetical protein